MKNVGHAGHGAAGGRGESVGGQGHQPAHLRPFQFGDVLEAARLGDVRLLGRLVLGLLLVLLLLLLLALLLVVLAQHQQVVVRVGRQLQDGGSELGSGLRVVEAEPGQLVVVGGEAEGVEVGVRAGVAGEVADHVLPQHEPRALLRHHDGQLPRPVVVPGVQHQQRDARGDELPGVARRRRVGDRARRRGGGGGGGGAYVEVGERVADDDVRPVGLVEHLHLLDVLLRHPVAQGRDGDAADALIPARSHHACRR